MDYKRTAAEILRHVGGEGNISHLEHCSTRLRFTLRDGSRADIEALKAVPGVLGVVTGAQCQVVIGNSVIEVYDELVKLGNFAGGGGGDEGGGEKKSFGAVILDFIVGVFQPLVPAIAGSGILKSLLLLFNMFGWLEKTGEIYTIFSTLADAAFYFLPLLVAVSAASKLKCNRYVALAAVGALVLPATATLLSADGGTRLFGLELVNVAYPYQVFPALLAVLFLAPVEKLFNRITPKPIRIFFVPLMSLAIVVPVTLVLLGPLGYEVGQLLTAAILFMFERFGWIAVTLLAMLLPFMIATGMHKALLPYAVSAISETGRELLYMPASLAHNISEGGACFAVALRTRDRDRRSTAVSAGISAVFGITEPALYGINLQNKRALASVIIGAGAGGAYLGLTAVEAFVAVGPGIASLSMFVSETSGRNIINAVVGAAVAFAAAFIAGLILYRDPKREGAPAPDGTKSAVAVSETVTAPVKGRVKALSGVGDEVFSAGILGEGIAVLPEEDKGAVEIKSPVNGVVASVFDSKHAISITSDGGAELLIHVGIDTVKLGGRYFEAAVSDGDRVTAGQTLLRCEFGKLSRAGFDTVIPVVLTNPDSFRLEAAVKSGDAVAPGEALLKLTKKEEKK